MIVLLRAHSIPNWAFLGLWLYFCAAYVLWGWEQKNETWQEGEDEREYP